MSDYDDLVPGAKAAPAAVPQSAAAPSAGGYDDLIPKGATKAVKSTDRSLSKLGAKIAKPIGGAIQYGHAHPFDAVLGALGAPQRALQAAETGGDVGRAFMTPKTGPALTNAVKQKIGLTGLEQGPLAGNDLGHKMMRGTLDTGLDIVNDPLTFVPFGKIADVAKGIPAIGKGVDAAGKALKNTPIGKVLDPEADLAGLTDKGKATFEAIRNRAVSNVKAIGDREEAVIRQYAGDIRKGVMPPQVAALFRKSSNIPTVTKGTRPQDVVSALARDRAPLMYQQTNRDLRNAGLINPGRGKVKVTLKNPADFFEDPSKMADVKNALGKVANPPRKGPPNMVIQAAKKATRLGNKAFLANPIPHAGNLTNLAYNRYGLPTTLAGIGNAARVATGTIGKGKLASDINELDQLGAKSQYRNIFDEMGLTRIAGIPGTGALAGAANKVLIPAQKLSNAAQHKILNSTETGLRAAALNAEKKGGKQGVEAARNIHTTFGTQRPSKAISDVSDLGTPFAQFHLQTAPMSGARTLARNPARVANVLKANRDFNNQVNPHGPEYRPTIPSMSTARAIADPLSYFSNLGPLSQLQSPFGAVEELKKGPAGVAQVAGDTAGRFIPGAPEMAALKDMIEKKRGKLGEKAMNDLISALVGGYYAKK